MKKTIRPNLGKEETTTLDPFAKTASVMASNDISRQAENINAGPESASLQTTRIASKLSMALGENPDAESLVLGATIIKNELPLFYEVARNLDEGLLESLLQAVSKN